MVRRPTMDEVRPVAQALVAASADDRHEAAKHVILAARRLGGGTRQGQTHVNLLLAQAFADILKEECPPQWRTLSGVPDVVRLTKIDDEQQVIEGYAREKRVATADAKARVATAATAAVIAEEFLKIYMRAPEQLGQFTVAAEEATGVIVDHVWGALWMACVKVRELGA